MSRSNIQAYFHFILGTKNREKLIPISIDSKLYTFIWNKCIELELFSIMINGTQNHIHLLVKSRSDITISEIARIIKGSSSKWLNENIPPEQSFNWQRGYGLFTVSPKDVDMIAGYIKKQKEHHQNGTAKTDFED